MTNAPTTRAEARAYDLLRASASFGSLGEDALRALVHDARLVGLSRGALYRLRGDAVDGVVIVGCGFLRVSLSNPQGKRHVLSYLEPGQLFDLLPVLDGGPAIHDADAATDVELIVLPGEVFRRVLQDRPEVGAAVQRLLAARFRLVYDGLADAMLLTLRQRCARTLLHAMATVGEPAGEGGATSIRLSQSEIADMLGNARPVVNRVLKDLQRDGVVELGHRHIVVVKPDALRAAAGT